MDISKLLKPQNFDTVHKNVRDDISEYRPKSSYGNHQANNQKLNNSKYDLFGKLQERKSIQPSPGRRLIVKKKNNIIENFHDSEQKKQRSITFSNMKQINNDQQHQFDQNTVRKVYGQVFQDKSQRNIFDNQLTERKERHKRNSSYKDNEIAQHLQYQNTIPQPTTQYFQQPQSQQKKSLHQNENLNKSLLVQSEKQKNYKVNKNQNQQRNRFSAPHYQLYDPQNVHKVKQNNFINQNPSEEQQSQQRYHKTIYLPANTEQSNDFDRKSNYFQNPNTDSNFSPEKYQNREFVDEQQFESNQEENRCYSVDYSFLDAINMDDPRLQEILSNDMLKDKNLNIDQILEENSDYFHHLFGNCACKKCTCGQCKCEHGTFKRTFKGGFKTLYKQDFSSSDLKKSQSKRHPDLNQNHYETLSIVKKQPQVDPSNTTLYKQTYVKHPLEPKVKKPHKFLPDQPMVQNTTYSNNFKNWQEYDPTYIFKRPQLQAVVGHEHPMDCNTIYKTTYEKDINKPKAKQPSAKEVKQSQYVNPMPEYWKEQNQPSMYKIFHKNYDPKKIISSRMPYQYFTETEQFHPIPSYHKQFTSTFTDNFRGLKEPDCPSKFNDINKPWKIKLKQKLKQSLQNKQQETHNQNRKQ